MQPTSSDQPNNSFFDTSNTDPGFTIALRGYDRHQVNEHLARLSTELNQHQSAKSDAEQRLGEAQHRVRAVEQQLTGLQTQLRSQQKQMQESSKPTLSGLGTRVEQLLRLAEEQANEHRNEAEKKAEETLGAARLQARELTEKARAEAQGLKATGEREAAALRDVAVGAAA
jgi:cell division septum initiation protein DivIVA